MNNGLKRWTIVQSKWLRRKREKSNSSIIIMTVFTLKCLISGCRRRYFDGIVTSFPQLTTFTSQLHHYHHNHHHYFIRSVLIDVKCSNLLNHIIYWSFFCLHQQWWFVLFSSLFALFLSPSVSVRLYTCFQCHFQRKQVFNTTPNNVCALMLFEKKLKILFNARWKIHFV